MNSSEFVCQVICAKCGFVNRYKIAGDSMEFYCMDCDSIALQLFKSIGFIYIMYSRAIPHLYKIGYTENHPSQRAAELSRATGVPMEYVSIGHCETLYPQDDEKKVHEVLRRFRVNAGREHFKVSLAQAVSVITQVTKSEFHLNDKSGNSLDALEQKIWPGFSSSGREVALVAPQRGSSFMCVKCGCKMLKSLNNTMKSKSIQYVCKRCSFYVDNNGKEVILGR